MRVIKILHKIDYPVIFTLTHATPGIKLVEENTEGNLYLIDLKGNVKPR
jgi:hypothetical protein